MARYTVVVEQGDGEFFADVPALPVCRRVAQTRGQALDNVVDAIHLSLGYLAEQGIFVPDSVETIAPFEID